MEDLIELAKEIKDKELRKKVVEFIKNPELSHKEFKKYPRMKIEEARTLFSAGSGSPVEREILNHTIALVELCKNAADVVSERYGIPINKDHLIAAALLHDLMHLFEYKKTAAGIEHTGVLLDHSMLAVAELYHREFPEQVIHIIASHFGETGPTPPRSFEALIMHYLDALLSLTEYHLYAAAQAQKQIPVVFLDEEYIKKLSGEVGEKKDKKSQ